MRTARMDDGRHAVEFGEFFAIALLSLYLERKKMSKEQASEAVDRDFADFDSHGLAPKTLAELNARPKALTASDAIEVFARRCIAIIDGEDQT